MPNESNEAPSGPPQPVFISDSQQAPSQVPIALTEELKSYVESEVQSRVDEVVGREDARDKCRELWSPRKVADYLCVPVQAVIRLIETGDLVATMVGGQRWIAVENLADYIARKTWDGDVAAR